MNIFYCNPCRHITKLLEKLISKGWTLALPVFDEWRRPSMLTTSLIRASLQQISQGPAPLWKLWIQTSATPSMYVCMYGHTYRKIKDQPGEVGHSARGQLNRENKYFPVLVRAWDFGLARRVRQPRPTSACSSPYSGWIWCHNCSMFGHYRRSCPNCRKQQYQGGQHQKQANGRPRARGRQQNRGEGIWCLYYKTTTHRDTNCRAHHKQDNGNANVSIVQPSRVGMCSALGLSE